MKTLITIILLLSISFSTFASPQCQKQIQYRDKQIANWDKMILQYQQTKNFTMIQIAKDEKARINSITNKSLSQLGCQ